MQNKLRKTANSVTVLCLSQARIWVSHVMLRGHFPRVEGRGDCSFC